MSRDQQQNNAGRIILTVLLALLAFSRMSAAPAGAEAKIDAGLMAEFTSSEDGTAPFFVVFAERTRLDAAHRMRNWRDRGRFVVDSLRATAGRSQNNVRGYLEGNRIGHTAFWIENKIFIPKGTLDLARRLAEQPEVAAILPEVRYPLPQPQATGGAIQSVGWNLSLIGANQVWATYGNRGAGIVVASIDTGAQYNHPALVRQYRGNLGGGSYQHAGNWYDALSACGGAPCDDVGHGSHVMGTMVGDDGGSNQIGVAPDAKWIACKACSASDCPASALIACAQWILAPNGDPALRPNIVNNSWAGGNGNTWYQSYVQNWVAAGIFPAFAVGNTGSTCGTAESPGDYPGSFASGATDSADTVASFSARGPSLLGAVKPDVSAPGVNIYSSVPTNGYAYYSGTSMASPHTAGVVALLWAVRPSYKGNVTATASLLRGNTAVRTTSEACGATPAGASPNNTYGSGRINAMQAIGSAGGTQVNQPPVVAISTPATDGQQFACGTAVNFAAAASDSENGALSTSIQWSGAGSPGSATGGSLSKTFSCTSELGNQTIAARVTDSGGLSATDTVVVNIVNSVGPPAAPSSLAISPYAMLTWTDRSSNETGFKLYRRQMSGRRWGSWALRQTIATANTTSYRDSIGTGSYQYYVTAYNSSGASSPSNTVSITK